jgi:Na+/serine symporter
MKDKGHFYTSIIKSILRIGISVSVFIISNDMAVKILATGFGVAEIVGIIEEIADRR